MLAGFLLDFGGESECHVNAEYANVCYIHLLFIFILYSYTLDILALTKKVSAQWN